MKTAKDPRHIKRIKTVKALFAESFAPQKTLPNLAKKVLSQKNKIDKKIQEAAPVWPVDKLNKIDLAMLRLAIFELENTKTPPKVVIDEAVEIAKEFGSESSPSFVNGVLGTIYKDRVEVKLKKKTKTAKDITQEIITILAEHIGTDEEELSSEDRFQNDIHMSATDLADFVEKLNTAGFDTTKLDLPEIESIGDLIENIISQEELN